MKDRLARILGLAMAAVCAWTANGAQTNLIYFDIGDYGQAVEANVNVTITLIAPNSRVEDGIFIRRDAMTAATSANGRAFFTNLLWGYYRADVAGRAGTTFYLNVWTNTTGTVNAGTLRTNAAALPPDPSTNYYTIPQVDLLIAGIDTSGGTATNVLQVGTTNSSGIIVGTNSLNRDLALDVSKPMAYAAVSGSVTGTVDVATYAASSGTVTGTVAVASYATTAATATNMDASGITSGTLDDARLASTIARTSGVVIKTNGEHWAVLSLRETGAGDDITLTPGVGTLEINSGANPYPQPYIFTQTGLVASAFIATGGGLDLTITNDAAGATFKKGSQSIMTLKSASLSVDKPQTNSSVISATAFIGNGSTLTNNSGNAFVDATASQNATNKLDSDLRAALAQTNQPVATYAGHSGQSTNAVLTNAVNTSGSVAASNFVGGGNSLTFQVGKADGITSSVSIGGGGARTTTNAPNADGDGLWLNGEYNGLYNTFVGDYSVGASNRSGYGNTFMGYGAGRYTTYGMQNTFIGWLAGYLNQTNFHNTYLGVGAGQQNQGNYNVFVGCDSALVRSNSSYSTIIGSSAGGYAGNYSTIIGFYAGPVNTANDVTFIGAGAGNHNTTGINTGIGKDSLYSVTSGSLNLAASLNSLRSLVTGIGNVGLGYAALYNDVAGHYNVGVGYQPLFYYTNGSSIGIGYQAGISVHGGTGNVFLGNAADGGAWYLENAMALGANATVTNSNEIVIGNPSVGSTILRGNITGPTNMTLRGNLSVSNNTTIGGTFSVSGNLTALGASNWLGTIYGDGSNLLGMSTNNAATNGGVFLLTSATTNIAINCATPFGAVTNAPLKFRYTLTNNACFENPSGMLDGQTILVEFIQDATGGRVAYFGTDFAFGDDITGITLSSGANRRDFATFVYSNAKWYCIGFSRGYQ